MAGPLIAVVGSFDPTRPDQKNIPAGMKAAEEIGRELARQGFRLLVFTSDANTLEVDVVRGYVSHPNIEPGSIQVRYPQQQGQPQFAEEAAHPDKFEFQPDFNADWEFSFYQSIITIDGMLTMAGGPWALIGGVIAMTHRKPLLACAGFGGSADKIWNAMRVQNYPLTPPEHGLMARSAVSPDVAAKLVGLLTKQIAEFARIEEERLASQDKRIREVQEQTLRENATINWHAILSALIFALAVCTWPLSAHINDSKYVLWTVLLTSILAGASGATVRVVVDWATGVTRTFALSTYNQYILLRYAALGVIAGGLAGVSFVLAQLFSTQTQVNAVAAGALTRLVPFLIIIGFAAGLTAEVVLSNLRKSPPAVEIPMPKKSS
jgi:hypothetical protein